MKDACPFSIFLVTVFFLDVISSVHYRDFVVSVRPKLRSMFSRTRFVNNKDVIPFVRFLKKFDELNSSRDIWLFVSKFFIINLRLRSGNLIYPRKTRNLSSCKRGTAKSQSFLFAFFCWLNRPRPRQQQSGGFGSGYKPEPAQNTFLCFIWDQSAYEVRKIVSERDMKFNGIWKQLRFWLEEYMFRDWV